MQENENLLIVKSNELIENFIFNATELELQILNYAVAITNPKWENKNVIYRISVADLVKTFEINSNRAWEFYRNALKRLMKKDYTYILNNGIDRTENLITRIDNPKDRKWLEFKFNDYISTRISCLTNFFTKYEIKYIAKFKSRYAFMLYEFFKMKLGQCAGNYSHNIHINAFKKNLGLNQKYQRFYDLNKIVLNHAKTNINKHSDIQLDYEVIKTGRTPTHIKFKAKYKKGKQPLIDTQKATTVADKKTTKALKQDKTIDYVKAQPIPDKTPEQINKDRSNINSLKDTMRKAGVKMQS